MAKESLPFNRPYVTGDELANINIAVSSRDLSGNGSFTKSCEKILERDLLCDRALLANSCTAALEMAALLIDIRPGDEVIMPSFTFVSTANAFVLRGAKIVFVDIRTDTKNIDEKQIEAAISNRTKAIVVVHYAGVSCEMDSILKIAKKYKLPVIEDAAQAQLSKYKGRFLGTIGFVGCLSFHSTKNIVAGEAGALLLNSSDSFLASEVIREKGTNRIQFLEGVVDKYSWIGLGSSYLPGELIAAFLEAQLKHANFITQERLKIWGYYSEIISSISPNGILSLPHVPLDCIHNGHMFYIMVAEERRRAIIEGMARDGIQAVSHYVPLHSSPAAKHYSRSEGDMRVTNQVAGGIIRLPLWVGMSKSDQERVAESLLKNLN